MIDITNVEIYGWKAAVRGMRNPLNSWEKSDSGYNDAGFFEVGENDLTLMKKLVAAGTDHRKFMRMITVTADICAPLYFFKEFDTYKIGTVANSCSTMHTIHKNPFELNMFSWEYLNDDALACLEQTIAMLNKYRDKYNETKDKYDWLNIIQLLPSSFEQKRTVMLNYETLANMYHARKSHKLNEWRAFCGWVETLPHAELITGEITQTAGCSTCNI